MLDNGLVSVMVKQEILLMIAILVHGLSLMKHHLKIQDYYMKVVQFRWPKLAHQILEEVNSF